MIVVVDINAIAFPFPIAAVVEVIRSHDPVGVVVKHDAARAVVDARGNEDLSHVAVAAVPVVPPGPDPFAIVVPIAIVVAVAVLVPTFVLAVVVAVIVVAIAVLVPTFVLAVVVIVAILAGRCSRKRPGQGHEQKSH